MKPNSNYTPEATKELVDAYEAGKTVLELSDMFNKSIKSIIGKLASEKVYIRSNYTTKTGDPVITKLELVAELEEYWGLDAGELEGLEKCPKAVLKKLMEVVNG